MKKNTICKVLGHKFEADNGQVCIRCGITLAEFKKDGNPTETVIPEFPDINWDGFTDSVIGRVMLKSVSDELSGFFSELGEELGAIINEDARIKDEYILLPRNLTADNGCKDLLRGEFSESIKICCPHCAGSRKIATQTCIECDGAGEYTLNVPVTWTTMKNIHAKIVANFDAHKP